MWILIENNFLSIGNISVKPPIAPKPKIKNGIVVDKEEFYNLKNVHEEDDVKGYEKAPTSTSESAQDLTVISDKEDNGSSNEMKDASAKVTEEEQQQESEGPAYPCICEHLEEHGRLQPHREGEFPSMDAVKRFWLKKSMEGADILMRYQVG